MCLLPYLLCFPYFFFFPSFGLGFVWFSLSSPLSIITCLCFILVGMLRFLLCIFTLSCLPSNNIMLLQEQHKPSWFYAFQHLFLTFILLCNFTFSYITNFTLCCDYCCLKPFSLKALSGRKTHVFTNTLVISRALWLVVQSLLPYFCSNWKVSFHNPDSVVILTSSSFRMFKYVFNLILVIFLFSKN